VVVPLGRGPAGFYSSYSERDVLDVLADVRASYPVDPERIIMGGYSMGGYGSLRFATLFPDLFAGYVNWVGFPGDCLEGTPGQGQCPAGAVGNVYDFLQNLRNVNGANLYAGEDELVTTVQSSAVKARLRELANPYIFYFHPAADHLTLALADDWRKEGAYTAPFVRAVNPPRVTYRTDPALDVPALAIAHDRAYWVSRIKARGPGYADADLTSFGCGGSTPVTAIQEGAGPDPVPWESEAAVAVGNDPLSQASRIEGTLGNVASLRVDSTGACLQGNRIAYRIQTDGPATIDFSNGPKLRLPASGTWQGVV
jgi:pimeloyl-ACP methyl ester carboxylesterase